MRVFGERASSFTCVLCWCLRNLHHFCVHVPPNNWIRLRLLKSARARNFNSTSVKRNLNCLINELHHPRLRDSKNKKGNCVSGDRSLCLHHLLTKAFGAIF
jgi:hypothetical protein